MISKIIGQIQQFDKKITPAAIFNWLQTLTSRFRITNKGFQKRIIKTTKNATDAFKNLKYISDETKVKLISVIRHHEIQLAVVKYWGAIMHNLILGVYLMLSFLSILYSPIVFLNSLNHSLSDSGNALFFSFVGLFISGALMVLFIRLLPRALNLISPIILLLTYLVTASWLYKQIGSVDGIVYPIIAALIGQIAYISTLLLTLMFATLNKLIFIRLQKTYYPDADIIHGLVTILSIMQNNSVHWSDVSVRSKLLENIESVAFCIEHFLYKKLKSGDLSTDIWFEQTTKKIAASLRLKKTWILTPRNDTANHFTKNISDTLISIANGDWDSLEKAEPEKIGTRTLWKDRLKDIGKVLFIGFSPIITLWFIQNSPLAISKPLSDYAIAGSLLWALFTSITTFDSSFSLKIDALKEIANLLPSLGKRP